MKKVKVVFSDAVYQTLREALSWDGRERAAYLLCYSSTYKDRVKLIPSEVRAAKEQDYVSRSSAHYELRKRFTNAVVNEAIDKGMDIIQCHVHPPGIGGHFSGVDATEEPKIMRHIAEKVLGIYHGSLVFSADFSELDGWFFDRDTDSLIPLEKVLVVGPKCMRLQRPQGVIPMKDAELPSYLNRTVQAYGQDAVRMLNMLDFGVFGASGLGGHLIEMLARDGASSISISDPDIIDETNLNRMPGTTRKGLGKPKVSFYKWFAKRINRNTLVMPYMMSLYEKEVQKAFAQADIIFGCLDSGARLSVNRLACANRIPYFDLGASIVVDNGAPSFVGGQIYSVLPGSGICLSCSGAFDSLRSEYLAPKERERESRQGYIQGVKGTDDPLVMHLDMALAGMAYHQMLKYIWGIGDKPAFKLYYDALKPKITAAHCSVQSCMTCHIKGMAGKGDLVPSLVPRKDEIVAVPIKGKSSKVCDVKVKMAG